MQPSDKIELRAIHKDHPDSVVRLRLSCKNYNRHCYNTFEIPNTTRLNQGQLKKQIGEFYGVSVNKVIIPEFIKQELKGTQKG